MFGADAEEAHWTCLELAGLVAGERGCGTEKEEGDMIDDLEWLGREEFHGFLS